MIFLLRRYFSSDFFWLKSNFSSKNRAVVAESITYMLYLHYYHLLKRILYASN